MRQVKKPAVFLDRDGTLIHEAHYLSDPRKARLYADAVPAVRRLNRAGYLVFLVTNQSGVARGYFTEADVKRVNRRIAATLERGGARLDGMFYCPHHREGTVRRFRKKCRCRKPGPGMVEAAARRFPLDLGRSYVVGDHAADVLLARNARLAGAVHLTTGHGRRERARLRELGVKVPSARSLGRAVNILLRLGRRV